VVTGEGDLAATADLVRRSLSAETADAFAGRLAEQADWLREQIEAGRMDNADFAVGLEMEVYAVEPTADVPRLARLPDGAFADEGTNKELGLHNAELNTEPNVLSGAGLAAQAEAIREHTAAASAAARAQDRELVLDGMWSVPPTEGTDAYLSAVEEHDVVVFAENMRPDPRYVAIDNATLESVPDGTIDLSVPGVDRAFPSILVESLATSIQPHLQIPDADAFPDYYNAAIRTLGPLLALAANSPFLPADLYGDVDDPLELVEDTHHELRIAVFEQSVDATPNPKVRVPRDLDASSDVVDRVVADDRLGPFLREWVEDGEREALAERVWEFDHKRGTYWRWLRCVIGGDPVDGAGDDHSLRIEYRPIPTQPTVTDTVSVQVFTAGLIRGLIETDHPVAELPWQDARASFYDAARNGPDADLAWVTAEGERTTDRDKIYGELFEIARAGLASQDVPEAKIEEFLEPMEQRWTLGATPSAWKLDRVRTHLGDHNLEDAIYEMQREYYELSQEHDAFYEWL